MASFHHTFFCKLKFLELGCFHDESAVVPLGFLQRFQNLEKLSLACSNFEELFSYETLEGEEKHAEIFTWIRNLRLDVLRSLKHIWKQDCRWEVVLQNLETLEVWSCDSLINLAPSSASLQNLTTLNVWKCTSLINLVTSSTAKSLMQLKIMKIRECHRVTEIVSHNEVDETEEIIFTKLKCLMLDKLSSLSSFCSVNYTFKFPSLEMVVVSQCPKLKIFSHGVLSTPLLHRVWLTQKMDEGRWERDLNATIQLLFTKMDKFRNLEYLTLSEFPRLVQIWHADAQNILDFKDLKVLKVDNCSSLRILFTQSMALCLVRLERMEIKDCTTMKKIITKEEGGGRAELDKIKFPRLETLLLESCPHLSCFYSGSDTLECPSLKRITLRDCPNMKTFASMFQREQNPPWTGSYGIMEPLGERGLYNPTVSFLSEKILFPNLEKLELSSMTIAKIWPDQSLKITSCIQNLKELTVKDCGSLKYLFQSSVVKSLVQLQRLEVHNCKIMERVMVTEASDDEGFDMLFLNLYDLRVENLPKLTRFCNGNLIEYPSLRWLVIKKCPELKAFISNAMSAEMTVSKDPVKKNLEDKLPADIQPLFDEKVGVPSLERLIIDEIENLEKIWHNQLAVDSFSKLDYFSVRNCKRLSSIFPSNMSSRLQRLDFLQILNCASLEVIFEHQVPNFMDSNGVTATQLIAVEAALRFVFSQVTILKLQELPELKSFYSGFHTTEWPLLKKLELNGCGKVEVLASEFMSFQEKHREIPIQQPLFLVSKATFPNLEELSLERNNVMIEIWHGKFSVEYFYKLKFLELIKFPEPVFPFHFLQTLPNLEKLVVSDASFKEIFQFEGLGDEEKVAGTLIRFRNLKLSKLPELMHLWKEEFQSDPIFQNLDYLELLECGKLKNLVPSSVSFENLTGLEVSKCHGLINLVEPSTAKNLVLLKRMCIVDCEMIEEIIANEGGEVKDGIIFSNLKYLRLDCLPNLGSFCSGDYAFDFPSLEEVIMGGCPKMNIFSQGVLSTPKLKRLQWTEGEDKRHWAGNLNTTIQQLFIEMKNVQNFEED